MGDPDDVVDRWSEVPGAGGRPPLTSAGWMIRAVAILSSLALVVVWSEACTKPCGLGGMGTCMFFRETCGISLGIALLGSLAVFGVLWAVGGHFRKTDGGDFRS